MTQINQGLKDIASNLPAQSRPRSVSYALEAGRGKAQHHLRFLKPKKGVSIRLFCADLRPMNSSLYFVISLPPVFCCHTTRMGLATNTDE